MREFVAVYDIGGTDVTFFTADGQGVCSYSIPGRITSPAALGPRVFAFNTPSATVCIEPATGREWMVR